MQLLPDAGLLPLAQPAPAGHPRAAAHLLRQVLPGDPRLQHEQDPGQHLPVLDPLSDRGTDAAAAPPGSTAQTAPTTRPTPTASPSSPSFRTRLTTPASSANRGSLLFVRRSKRPSDPRPRAFLRRRLAAIRRVSARRHLRHRVTCGDLAGRHVRWRGRPGLTRRNWKGGAVRFRIDQEQLSEFLSRQVRLVEGLPVEAAEAAADGYRDGLDDAEREAVWLAAGWRRSSGRRSWTSRSGSSSPPAEVARPRREGGEMSVGDHRLTRSGRRSGRSGLGRPVPVGASSSTASTRTRRKTPPR